MVARAEIYRPSFCENEPKTLASVIENERFGLVLAKTRFTTKNLNIQSNKLQLNFLLGLPTGLSSYRRSLQPQRENIQHFITCNLLLLVVPFSFPGSGSTDLTESVSDPDPKHWFNKITFHWNTEIGLLTYIRDIKIQRYMRHMKKEKNYTFRHMTKQMCRYWNIYIHCCPANIEIALKIPTVQGTIFVLLKQAASAVFKRKV